jgi:hypothetical protein
MWIPEHFMDRVVQTFGFDQRGFGVKFDDDIATTNTRMNFSAKFWVGRNRQGARAEILDKVRELFSPSSIRFGRDEQADDTPLSSQLYELYHDGRLTVNTCSDVEEMLELARTLRESYSHQVSELEKQRERRDFPVEAVFAEPVDFEQMTELVRGGRSGLQMWLHRYALEPDVARFAGSDLHTGDPVTLDLGGDYAYVGTSKKACMNMAPRYGTLAARHLSTRCRLYVDGAEVFADVHA